MNIHGDSVCICRERKRVGVLGGGGTRQEGVHSVYKDDEGEAGALCRVLFSMSAKYVFLLPTYVFLFPYA